MIVRMAGELFSHVFTVTRLNISQARAAFTENYKHSVIFVVGCSRNDQSESPVRFGTFAIEVCWIYSDSYLYNDSNHMISVNKTISKYIFARVYIILVCLHECFSENTPSESPSASVSSSANGCRWVIYI